MKCSAVVLASAAIVLTSCGSATDSASTRLTVTPSVLSIDGIGLSQTVTAALSDQSGASATDVYTWRSSNTSVASVTSVGTTGTIRSVAAGTATITVARGDLTASTQVTVLQTPASLAILGGNNQLSPPGSALPAALQVVVRDRNGAPISGKSVSFAVASGGGTIAPASVTTDFTGIATSRLTLGSTLGAQAVTASTADLPAVAFNETAGGTTGIVMFAGDNLAAMAGTATPVTPAVIVLANGVPTAGVPVTFAVTSGGGTITGATTASGVDGVARLGSWTLGSEATANTVSATAGGTFASQPALTFLAAGCSNNAPASTFTITLCFHTSMTPFQKATFNAAADRWGRTISSHLSTISFSVDDSTASGCDNSSNFQLNVRDLLIFASVGPIDGKSAVLGFAGPCYIRLKDTLTVVGTMLFDEADTPSEADDGSFASTVLHEMGHVLGIGTLWSAKKLLGNATTSTTSRDTYFSGTNTIDAFNSIGGATYTGNKVPVHNLNGAGSYNSHWRASVFKNELMNPFAYAGISSYPLSIVTVQSLKDIGYQVDVSSADAFTLPTAGSRLLQLVPVRSFENDERTGPLYFKSSGQKPTRVP